jgi:signal transduction histidine kinase
MCFGDGRVHTTEMSRKTEDGLSYFEITASPLMDLKGRITAGVEVFHDITERKRAEKEIIKYSQELERSNRLKELFTDIMHHDLLTPAGIILNYAEIMLEETEDPQVKEDAEVIKKNVKKLIELIENSSKLAKLEGEKKLELDVEDLGAVIQGVVSNLRQAAMKKEIHLEYKPKKARAMANPLIEEVFSNLLSNAVKYSPEHSRIVVEIDDAGSAWKITFADQGIGIPDEEKRRIFERFSRREKAGVKGTGLGLAIAKRIVDLHQGKIWVEDNTPKGSVFYVKLPKEA